MEPSDVSKCERELMALNAYLVALLMKELGSSVSWHCYYFLRLYINALMYSCGNAVWTWNIRQMVVCCEVFVMYKEGRVGIVAWKSC
jgi:hypothetical protein